MCTRSRVPMPLWKGRTLELYTTAALRIRACGKNKTMQGIFNGDTFYQAAG
jgi:hypothetical protein